MRQHDSRPPMDPLIRDGTSLESERVLAELIAAARDGTAETCPDWKYRPAWRQRLWLAVRNYDALPDSAPRDAPREAGRGALVVQDAPKSRAVMVASNLTGDFARFMAVYPKKSEGGPLAAEGAYAKARKIATADEIMTGLLTYPFREDPNYQPSAQRWLEKGCWMAERDTAPPTIIRERSGKRHEAAELAEDLNLDLVTPISEQFPKGGADVRLPARRADYSVAD